MTQYSSQYIHLAEKVRAEYRDSSDSCFQLALGALALQQKLKGREGELSRVRPMSEFQLAGGGLQGPRSGPAASDRGQVEWYQAGAATYPSTSAPAYSFDAPSGYMNNSSSDTFEDEAPLLEGILASNKPSSRLARNARHISGRSHWA